ncbi:MULTISPECIES: ABC transporter ATP-binding protein [unclassified Paracoccus (in: a-proteobacteria)]|uniref:ABC transporter ATP-binding protein n=1 Tax=unclassified Paracoccus (in: a-proteobacteria) TaxID=2688777 RepID=UPI0012B2864D|nr:MULTISPECIES: ABC transporter ATP-binding protein [unclassified Paracoccus (in: a-proteobacteria)]UXU76630.1 ABC transporter ATP-binding protein [Paracoccus sp. SMMA_5]UXU82518.1 ABC transporter ATP-binding protein [Paracoccus sp. SMMA_5_TC]
MNQYASPRDRVSQPTVPVPQTPPCLRVEALSRRFGPVAAVQDVSFQVAPGQVTCLLGPSGCGKSTTLRMIAGIERPDAGRICIDGRVMSDDRLCLPPEARSIGMVFQDFALFPHLDIAANVGFGLKGPGLRQRVLALLDRVGLAGHAAKFPHELSGGEQQRVALVRALAPGPCLMLMDEPFSSLDHRLRDGVRDAALELLHETGTAVVMVTHDPEEAMLMGQRIVVMRKGRLIQEGRPQEIYDRPVDRGVAAFFSDLNLVEGRVAAGRIRTELGDFPAPGLAEGTLAEVAIRPQHLRIDAGGGPVAMVERARYLGREMLLDLRLVQTGRALRARLPADAMVLAGGVVHVGAAAPHVLVFPQPA